MRLQQYAFFHFHNRLQNYGNFLRNQSFQQLFLLLFKISGQNSNGYFCAMNEILSPDKKPEGFKISKLFQYFLQGVLIIAPITITVYTIYWVVSSIDNLIPIFYTRNQDGRYVVQNYGLG